MIHVGMVLVSHAERPKKVISIVTGHVATSINNNEKLPGCYIK